MTGRAPCGTGLVILIDPYENPDGRERYLAQILSFAHRTANPDQDDLSHAASGRGAGAITTSST